MQNGAASKLIRAPRPSLTLLISNPQFFLHPFQLQYDLQRLSLKQYSYPISIFQRLRDATCTTIFRCGGSKRNPNFHSMRFSQHLIKPCHRAPPYLHVSSQGWGGKTPAFSPLRIYTVERKRNFNSTAQTLSLSITINNKIHGNSHFAAALGRRRLRDGWPAGSLRLPKRLTARDTKLQWDQRLQSPPMSSHF